MKFVKKHLFLLILVLFTFVYVYLNTGVRYNFAVLTVFFATGLFSLYGLFLSADVFAVSLNKTFCLFYYFFFVIAPVTQFKHNIVFFVNMNISDALYIKGGFLLLAIILVYLILYHIIHSYLNKHEINLFKNRIENQLPNPLVLVVFSFISVLFYFYLIKFNWNLILFRPFSFLLKNNTNLGLIGYAILLVVQLIPFVSLVRYKISTPISDKYTYILFFLMLVVCFPTSLSRGVFGMLYIPLSLLFIPFLNQKKYYIKMYLVGLLVAFPLFNNFRHLYERTFDFNYQLFDTGHFDSFQNFVFLLDEKIITNGRQLLGSVFFFIQESQWNNRPVGTGTMLAQKLGYSFTNVDMSLFGEGYANFGYFGIFLFLIFITIFNAFLDYLFANEKMNYLLKIVFYFFLGFEFYLLRGDLYSSIKILTSFGLSLGFVELVLFFCKKVKYD